MTLDEAVRYGHAVALGYVREVSKPEPLFYARISASASYGHACHIGLGR
jgi:hypothetical protein